jgi:uncharacterized membrane protein
VYVHIMAGVAWAGSAFLFTVFIEPAAAKLGPAAGPFMEETIGRRKVPEIITAIAAVTVLAGWVLWFGDMNLVGFGNWIGSSFGLVLTIGWLAATGAFLAGLIGSRPTSSGSPRSAAKWRLRVVRPRPNSRPR